jgi:hypothetical protein
MSLRAIPMQSGWLAISRYSAAHGELIACPEFTEGNHGGDLLATMIGQNH